MTEAEQLWDKKAKKEWGSSSTNQVAYKDGIFDFKAALRAEIEKSQEIFLKQGNNSDKYYTGVHNGLQEALRLLDTVKPL